MDATTIERVMVGRRAVLGPDGNESAIRKDPVDGPVEVTSEGPAGDEHVYAGHGGPDKAILHCAAEHYDVYRKRHPEFVADLNSPRRGFGENISTHGMTEETVCVGDRYRIGPAGSNDGGIVVEVTGFRQPCWKLGYNCGVREVPKVMQDEGTTGWYYRVLEQGAIAAGDVITLLDRPYPEWTVARLARGFYGTPLDRAFLDAALALPPLGGELRRVMEERIATAVVERWDERLYGT